ncbi:toxin-antitoxin system HicB family antitoxin [Saccharicrinis fermentans]|nr:toxin-antitoxin system HicB family antitoxin [Saccharicrinis fermentans]
MSKKEKLIARLLAMSSDFHYDEMVKLLDYFGFKGSFNVRLSPKLHQRAALLAMEDKMSLNNFVAESIRERIFRETGNPI